MPLFQLRCTKCGATDRVLADSEPVGLPHRIKMFALGRRTVEVVDCGGVMERTPIGPNSSQIEVLDNGAMTRRLERFADAERLHKERAANGDPLAGGVNRVDPRERT